VLRIKQWEDDNMNVITQPTPNNPSDEPSDQDKSGIVIDL